jgi:hypothetical protein
MSDFEDEKDKVAQIALEELEKLSLDDTQKVLLRANEALVVHELRRVLERQAERDLAIDEMRNIIDTLAVGQVLAIEEIKKLQSAYSLLLRHQSELSARQDIIAGVCDAFASKLEEETKARVTLAEDVADRD